MIVLTFLKEIWDLVGNDIVLCYSEIWVCVKSNFRLWLRSLISVKENGQLGIWNSAHRNWGVGLADNIFVSFVFNFWKHECLISVLVSLFK